MTRLLRAPAELVRALGHRNVEGQALADLVDIPVAGVEVFDGRVLRKGLVVAPRVLVDLCFLVDLRGQMFPGQFETPQKMLRLRGELLGLREKLVSGSPVLLREGEIGRREELRGSELELGVVDSRWEPRPVGVELLGLEEDLEGAYEHPAVEEIVAVLDEGPHELPPGGVELPTGAHVEGIQFERRLEVAHGLVELAGGPGAQTALEALLRSSLPLAFRIPRPDQGHLGGTFRFTDNRKDYQLGNQGELGLWLSRGFTSWLSASLRLRGEIWGDINGADDRFNPAMVPTADPDLRGGRRIDALVGTNIFALSVPLADNRIALEFGVPVYQSLNGPQPNTEWYMSLTCNWTFGG